MNQKPHVTVAICTYNRADYLPALVEALRSQSCPFEFDILFINNNSKDNTLELLQELSDQSGISIRVVSEPRQGIVHARNRAIEECLNSDYVLVMDDDELPSPTWVEAAYEALKDGDADCVGGRVDVCFDRHPRPTWLGDELLGFLAETDYGSDSFTITDDSTPIWTANIAYNMRIFRDDPNLRFDARYNREGDGVGGGEDVIMFNALLNRSFILKYVPAMKIYHHIEKHRLKQRYFYKLHFTAGIRKGEHEINYCGKKLFGVPLFLFGQAFNQTIKTIRMILVHDRLKTRQGMNACYAFGLIFGTYKIKNKI